jgi:hypothetical protein
MIKAPCRISYWDTYGYRKELSFILMEDAVKEFNNINIKPGTKKMLWYVYSEEEGK